MPDSREFGSFLELSGGGDLRGDASRGKMNPPVLSGAFRNPTPEGFVERSGYHYAIYLPGHSGFGILADVAGFGGVHDDLAETTWCMYAWPAEYGKTGTRTFMVNQAGDVVATDSSAYSGKNGPRPGAAFRDGGSENINGYTAIGVPGQDGNVWRKVN